MSPRFRRYLQGTEPRDHEGRFALVPSYERPMQVHLEGRALERLKKHAPQRDGWVPLATLGREEPQYLVVEATDPVCPVAMWEHETGKLVPCADSLDAFLEHLGETEDDAKAGALAVDRIRAVVERGIGLTDKRVTAKAKAEIETTLVELEPMLSRLPSAKSLVGTEHHGLHVRALFSKGRMLRALGRFEEACAALGDVEIDGELRRVAPTLVCEMLLHDLDRPDEVVTLCERAGAEARHDLWGAALLRLGRPDEALVHLSTHVQGREAVLTRTRGMITQYAKKRRLVAEAAELLAKLG